MPPSPKAPCRTPARARALVAVALLSFGSLAGCGSSGGGPRDEFTQQDFDEFNRWCLNVANETPAKCLEVSELIQYHVNEAGHKRVDEACLVYEMQRDVIGFGLYNSWDCIEE